jgi:hypothetical protein
MLAATDGLPAVELGSGRLVEAALPPAPQDRVEIEG